MASADSQQQRSSSSSNQLLLVRAPATSLAKGQVTHIERSNVDVSRAKTQWAQYVETLCREGHFDRIDVQQDDRYPDSVFVEDSIIFFGPRLAILCAPDHASPRYGEREGVEAALQALISDEHIRVESITGAGRLDGGDVLKVHADKTAYIGLSARTNLEGIEQVRGLVASLGWKVVAVPIKKTLHLKSQVTALPDGSILGYEPLIDDVTFWTEQQGRKFVGASEPEGAAVVVLGPQKVLMSNSASKTAETIRGLGYEVVIVDIAEFEKLEGCPTCLSVRVR
ncbi:dimethylarginine dimethylaminohydrolase [Powellomyces hirtus]|nr:dimethylarginine dimethylaminohydrolase [Powellomyces hirtus]